jgi:high-affinity iron transporter
MWFGLYATWEGIGFQFGAAVFVIGSYVLAERVQQRQVKHPHGQTGLRESAPARPLALREKESNTL